MRRYDPFRALRRLLLISMTMSFAVLVACSDDDETPTADGGTSADASAFDAAIVDCSEVTEITLETNIDSPTTLTGVNGCVDYRIASDVNVTAALTIEPGVHVVVEQGRRLSVTGAGSITAIGTQTAPIVFEGTNPSAGFWDGINVETLNAANELTWVEISHGGDGSWANIYVASTGSLKLTHSTSTTSGTAGLIAKAGADLSGFASNTFAGNTAGALRIPAEEMGSLDADSTYLGTSAGAANGSEVIEVVAGPITTDQTWPATDAPFRLANTSQIKAAVTVSPGFHAVAAASARLDVTTEGSLTAKGTSAAHISFAGENPSAGFWDGINFESTSTDNILDYVDISYGGDGSWANLYVGAEASVRVSNSSFSESGTAGAIFKSGSSIEAFASNTFASNTTAALDIGFEHIGRLDDASRYNGEASADDDNTVPYINVRSGQVTEAQTWPATDAPFLLNNTSTIKAAVTVSPGARFVANTSARINVETGGSLNAVADKNDAASAISFVGLGGTPGYWDGLHFESTSSSNELRFVTIAHGGDGSWANIYISSGGSVTVVDCTISDSETYGLVLKSGGSVTPSGQPDLAAQNEFKDNASGAIQFP